MDNKRMKSQMQSGAYAVSDIVTILSIGQATAHRLVNEGNFKTVRIGNSIRIPKKSFEDWLKMKRLNTKAE